MLRMRKELGTGPPCDYSLAIRGDAQTIVYILAGNTIHFWPCLEAIKTFMSADEDCSIVDVEYMASLSTVPWT